MMALPVVVHAHGVFDVLHYGHLIHLQQARTFGDVLIVTVTADKYVFKGPNRPVFKQHQRVAMLRALAIVDDVRIIDAPGAEDAIRAVRANIYVKGMEYQGKLTEEPLVISLGGKVMYTYDPAASTIKTTKILRHYIDAGELTRES